MVIDLKPAARAAIVEDVSWSRAVGAALERTRGVFADVAILFASAAYGEHYPDIVRTVLRDTGASVLVGCSGQGIIGLDQELEEVPSLALLTLSLPGARLRPVQLSQSLVDAFRRPEDWHDHLKVGAREVNAWLVFADPFRLDCERLVGALGTAFPGSPVLGGLASGNPGSQGTHVFLNDEVFDSGAVALGLGGPYSILPLVSQGCEPIGSAWTVTGAEGNFIQTISNRPAHDVLVETFRGLPPELRDRAQGNLLVGLAADEYRDEFRRGDFLIRNLLGLDRRTGALAIGAVPRVGQTIQFQLRDARAADNDLNELLDRVAERVGDRDLFAAVLCSCNGRGIGLFGTPDHDARAIAGKLGSLPLAGLFCNGEIGPVGNRPFLHGFTASLAMFVRDALAGGPSPVE